MWNDTSKIVILEFLNDSVMGNYHLLTYLFYQASNSRILFLKSSRRRWEQIHCLKERRVLNGTTRVSKKNKEMKTELDERNYLHVLWWKEVGQSTLLSFLNKLCFLCSNIVCLSTKFSFVFAEARDVQKAFFYTTS